MFHSLSQLGLQRNYINIRYLFDHCMNVTFAGSRSNAHGHWFDPKNWLDERYGVDEIEKFSHHFSMPLVESGFELQKCFSEWKHFKFYVKANNYKPAERDARNVWKWTLQYHRNEYPNLCLPAEIIISLSGSNSSAERAFSTLSNILSDKRMSSKHATLENLLPVKLNDKVWNDVEREEIIYLKKLL